MIITAAEYLFDILCIACPISGVCSIKQCQPPYAGISRIVDATALALNHSRMLTPILSVSLSSSPDAPFLPTDLVNLSRSSQCLCRRLHNVPHDAAQGARRPYGLCQCSQVREHRRMCDSMHGVCLCVYADLGYSWSRAGDKLLSGSDDMSVRVWLPQDDYKLAYVFDTGAYPWRLLLS